MQLLAILALAVPVAAFIATPSRPSTVALNGVKSVAIPFLDRPAKLDGTSAGDVGFDPLGFTENVPNLHYVKEAEIKHGRVAMLAVVGYLFQKVHHPLLPDVENPLAAVSALGLGPQLQVLIGIGFIELATWDGTFSGSREAGNFGFDPLKFSVGKPESEVKALKLKEIKNGRLAMLASIGMFAENIIFDGKLAIGY